MHRTSEEISLGLSPLLEVTSFLHIAGEYSGGRVFPRDNDHRLIFVLRGRLALRSSGRQLTLGSSEAYLTDPTTSSSISYDEGADFYVFRFRSKVARAEADQVLRVPDGVRLINCGPMTHLIRMFEYYSRGERKSKRILRHLVVLMLCELVRPARSSDTSSTLEGGLESIASRVDAYIAAHYNRDKATNDIAMALHYNPHYLERVYRAERGISIREAIQVRRIQEARAQLRLQRTDGVAKIAARCGYSDVAYFRRLFKRATGATPQEYRTAHALLAIPWNERDMHHD